MSTAKTRLALLALLTLARVTFSKTPTHTPGAILIKLKGESLSAAAWNGSAIPGRLNSLATINQRLNLQKAVPLCELANIAQTPGATSLSNLFKLNFPPEQNLDEILQAYRNRPEVEYAQLNHVFKLRRVPNDSLFTEQINLQVVRAEQAWEVQLGSPDVVIGVIDTGIDYDHVDLRDAVWINPGEDLDGNGRADSTDINGIDDDRNGFIDDIRGWDFTDAPSFPDGGDFETPDNDPFDENGHGTSVAGIIGATGDNGSGIAGLAYGCRVMALRAGTALGFLEEDDVASAIVYAVENGARIINMSFGDTVASPLLRDVMKYAYSRGVVLVASAGNSATDLIHFPSGFAETISVGATNSEDRLAGFSNYGSSVDLVAPGVNILTTKRDGQYGGFSGTSASAPFVAALSGLLLSKTPQLSPESIKGLLTTSSTDLGTPGWDNFFAAGRIDAAASLESPYFSVAELISPQVDEGFSRGPIAIRGTASGTFVTGYSLQIGVGETPESWQMLETVTGRQVRNQHLFDLDTSALQDSVYTLRLVATNQGANDVEDKIRFFIDRSPPKITGVTNTPMLDGDRHSLLIEFETDDVCDAAILFRKQESTHPFTEQKLGFRTTTHRFHFTQDIFVGQMEFLIEAANGAGLNAVTDPPVTANLDLPPLGGIATDESELTFPSGFLLARPADFDGDGRPEIVLSEYDDNFNFGPLTILELEDGAFTERFAGDEVFIPRDWGDSDGDGLLEILTGRGSQSWIFEAAAPGEYPTQPKWHADGPWASRFADFDQDGQGELVLRQNDVFGLWEVISESKYALVDSFSNPTQGSNTTGVPHSEIADFDGDGQLEILLGDGDGDITIHENRGDNRSEFTWSDRLPLVDATDYLTHGDYDGDGVEEFVAGCHSDPSLNLESAFDSRHWRFRIYKNKSDNNFAHVWEQAFFGFQSPRDFDSGVASGDVDNDGRPEILISIFPDFYIVDYNEATESYQVIWHAKPSRSNTAIVADWNGNGGNEFYFNTGVEATGFEFVTDFAGPQTPTAFRARPLDSTLVELSWQHAGGADGFNIYRGLSRDGLALFAQTDAFSAIDSSVSTGIDYWYAVSAVAGGAAQTESRQTTALRVRPGPKPFLRRATYLPPDQIQIEFSERMNQSVRNQTRYTVNQSGIVESAVSHKLDGEVVLTVAQGLLPGLNRISVAGVADLDGTPIDTSRSGVEFEVTEAPLSPYLEAVNLVLPTRLEIQFSLALDPESASTIDNYEITPNVRVVSAVVVVESPDRVLLEIDPESPIGPFGIEYFLRVRNVRSADSIAIRFGEGDTAALIFSSTDLDNVHAYPNPCRPSAGHTGVTIAGLTSQATVRILDISGRLIRTIEETDGNGGVEWDLNDENGLPMASGIYIFYVEGDGKNGKGKLAVVR